MPPTRSTTHPPTGSITTRALCKAPFTRKEALKQMFHHPGASEPEHARVAYGHLCHQRGRNSALHCSALLYAGLDWYTRSASRVICTNLFHSTTVPRASFGSTWYSCMPLASSTPTQPAGTQGPSIYSTGACYEINQPKYSGFFQ